MDRNIELVKQALEGIEITEANKRFIEWISNWDRWTVNQFVEIIKKSRDNKIETSRD